MKKINIAELLKDCPQGMELDCVSYDNISFDKISDDKKATYPIFCYITDKEGNRSGISFTEHGCESKRYGAKCVIFPKGKTTWDGFVPPIEFNDGDILYVKSNKQNEYIIIFKEIKNDYIHKYVSIVYNCIYTCKCAVCHLNDVEIIRLATEEEKQKLFNGIKINGYNWNNKTKTLEKLPIFKDGDILATNDGKFIAIVKKNGGKHYCCCHINSDWFITDYSGWFDRFATEEEKQKLFNAIKANGYKWNDETKTLEKLIKPKFKVGDRIKHKNSYFDVSILKINTDCYIAKDFTGDQVTIDFTHQDNYELILNKFDITTLKSFESRVLVRDYDNQIWIATFWGKRLENDSNCSYLTTNGCYKYCIPYEGNENLFGTTNDCDEFYKTWEK